MSDSVLIVRGLSHSFDGVQTLLNIDLQVHRHEFVALVGPTGCGKTTLLHLICGHDNPSGGSVIRSGGVRMIHQKDGLFPWLTAGENILLGLRHIRDEREKRRRLADLFSLIGLERFAEHFPHQLSGGMRQLVELARAIAAETDVLLMDEPFSSLDYLSRVRMRRELARILDERPRTVMLVTHDIEEAAELADRLIVLSERPGRIRCELTNSLPRPRSPAHPSVVETIRRVLSELGLGDHAAYPSKHVPAAADARKET
jgi:NitT/TauT family transport system ATP-binding protein